MTKSDVSDIQNIIKSMEEAYPQYMNYLDNEALLNRNIELCKMIRKGNKEAETELIVRNRMLVYKICAKCFVGNDAECAYIEGLSGLIRAANTYKEDIASFSTYCYYWVKQRVERFANAEQVLVRLPEHARQDSIRVNKFLANKQNSNLTNREIAEELEMTEEKVTNIREYLRTPLSIQQEISDSDSLLTLQDIIVSDDNVEEDAANNMIAESIKECIAKLSKRERFVLTQRFGLDGKGRRTLNEVGNAMGVTRERVRQIECNALDKLGYMREMQEIRKASNMKDYNAGSRRHRKQKKYR